ncbi:hypothetical protein [Acidocella sp.]|uniref:hypothetical protein n=1 Tax=Acidocella sp. TaxID=50710 RepID=UPI003D00DD9B
MKQLFGWVLLALGVALTVLLFISLAFIFGLPLICFAWLHPTAARIQPLIVPMGRHGTLHIYVTPLVAKLYDWSWIFLLACLVSLLLAVAAATFLAWVRKRRHRYRRGW